VRVPLNRASPAPCGLTSLLIFDSGSDLMASREKPPSLLAEPRNYCSGPSASPGASALSCVSARPANSRAQEVVLLICGDSKGLIRADQGESGRIREVIFGEGLWKTYFLGLDFLGLARKRSRAIIDSFEMKPFFAAGCNLPLFVHFTTVFSATA